MRIPQQNKSAFQKVGECLYRYAPTGGYYARVKVNGKEVRHSLRTTDRALAKRELARFKDEQRQIDRSKGKMTLAEFCDRYLETIQGQKRKTFAGKELVVRRIKADWPTGRLTQVAKIKPSDVDIWLARYQLGASARNVHVSCAREIFDMAVRDKVIPKSESPAAHLTWTTRPKPIRKTPSFDEFKQIVQNIREQQFSDTAEESADFVEFLGLAGLGTAEAAALTWGDIDWQRNTITTFRHKTATGFAIPIYPQVRPLLEGRLAASSGASDENVFRVKDTKKAIASACKRLRLPAYSHRSFRRMFITRAIEKGVDVKVIAEWQGHKDGGKLILDTYSHVNRVHSHRMAQLMTDLEPENVVALTQGAA
jgi:integrase